MDCVATFPTHFSVGVLSCAQRAGAAWLVSGSVLLETALCSCTFGMPVECGALRNLCHHLS